MHVKSQINNVKPQISITDNEINLIFYIVKKIQNSKEVLMMHQAAFIGTNMFSFFCNKSGLIWDFSTIHFLKQDGGYLAAHNRPVVVAAVHNCWHSDHTTHRTEHFVHLESRKAEASDEIMVKCVC